jgi:cytochrome P450
VLRCVTHCFFLSLQYDANNYAQDAASGIGIIAACSPSRAKHSHFKLPIKASTNLCPALSHLCLQHGAINYAEAASSGIGLIIAGNDTSGLGVSALLATLPLFPEVVEKLRQEQQQVGVTAVFGFVFC